MNPILHSSKKIIRLADIKTITTGTKIIKPCGNKCLCLMFLDLSEKVSQTYYDHCYRTKIKK